VNATGGPAGKPQSKPIIGECEVPFAWDDQTAIIQLEGLCRRRGRVGRLMSTTSPANDASWASHLLYWRCLSRIKDPCEHVIQRLKIAGT